MFSIRYLWEKVAEKVDTIDKKKLSNSLNAITYVNLHFLNLLVRLP